MGVIRIRMRVANGDDAAELARLNRDAQRVHVGLAPHIFRSDVDDAAVAEHFAKCMAAPGHSIYIADLGADPCGYAWYEVQDRSATAFSFAMKRLFVHHVVVSEGARRHGLASALMSQIELEAVVAGAAGIALDTWTGNEAAQQFFAAKGFAPYRIGMTKRVGE